MNNIKMSITFMNIIFLLEISSVAILLTRSVFIISFIIIIKIIIFIIIIIVIISRGVSEAVIMFIRKL